VLARIGLDLGPVERHPPELDQARLLAQPADDDRVLAVAGVGISVSLAAWFACEGDRSMARHFDLFDAAMAHLESALPP
jgi:hypothetical protein